MQIGLLAAASLTLAGCGGSGGSSTVNSSTTSTNSTPPAKTIVDTVLYSIGDTTTDTGPANTLVRGSDGNFYFTTADDAGGVIYRITPSGSEELFARLGAGITPTSLIQGSDGNLYGTTSHGGSTGGGILFKVTPGGVASTVHTFCSQPSCTDGAAPTLVIQGSDGDLYGVATYVFKISPGGSSYQVLNAPGNTQVLIQGSDGNFYGGTMSEPLVGCDNSLVGPCVYGRVYKMTPSGTATTLHTFNGSNGTGVNFLIQGSDGNLYGTTPAGATINGSDVTTHNLGSVFKLTPAGEFTAMYTFPLASDGSGTGPDGDTPTALVQDTSGNLYVATQAGGTSNAGVIVSFNPAGLPSLVYSFKGGTQDGNGPTALADNGNTNLFCVTRSGGAHDMGTFYTVGLVAAPAAPLSLTAAARGSGTVVLTWKPVAGATSYNIFQSFTSGGEGVIPTGSIDATTLGSGSTVSVQVPGLTNGTTYYFEVSAAITGAQSAPSNEASAVPTVSGG